MQPITVVLAALWTVVVAAAVAAIAVAGITGAAHSAFSSWRRSPRRVAITTTRLVATCCNSERHAPVLHGGSGCGWHYPATQAYALAVKANVLLNSCNGSDHRLRRRRQRLHP